MKRMKYWLYLFAKLAMAAGVVFVLLRTLIVFYPEPHVDPKMVEIYGPPQPLLYRDMLFPFLFMSIWLIAGGLFWLILRDQRRRCRTCLRRLIMPVNSGSWGHLVTFGRPRTEFICPFGHGTLSIEELQITGRHFPDWQLHDDDIWKELESYYQTQK
jgi:hypothetical protein